MDLREVRDLRPGDEIFWNDPDEGLCSRYITIQEIDLEGDMLCILDKDGGYLECFPHELS